MVGWKITLQVHGTLQSHDTLIVICLAVGRGSTKKKKKKRDMVRHMWMSRFGWLTPAGMLQLRHLDAKSIFLH